MAHHQHHGHKFDSDSSLSTKHSRPSALSTIPSVPEEESLAEVDEPPDMASKRQEQTEKPIFTKTACRPMPMARRESLLTRGLHTDSDSHDDHHRPTKPILQQYASRSSTCSTQDTHSIGNWTSDELHSPSTRASTPTSPRSSTSGHKSGLPKIQFVPAPSTQTSSPEKSAEEAKVETELGRKRCIKFFCNTSKPTPAPITEEVEVKQEAVTTEPAEPPKRKCAITFACARVTENTQDKDGHPRAHPRIHSPAPHTLRPSAMKDALNGDLAAKGSSPSPSSRSARRGHRDSDSTVKLDSPKASFRNLRRLSAVSQPPRTEATRFHEFCSSEEEVEDWLQQTTCHRSRLTVEDTLKKENDIRRLTEQAEEEALQDEEDDDNDDDEVDLFSDYDLEDDGFQSDIEAGFASSDEEDDDGSDFEWWTARPSGAIASSPFAAFKSAQQPGTAHTKADDTDDEDVSPSESRGKSSKKSRKSQKTRPVNIKQNGRTDSPELPDSTDFVCGTLDEDRPLEEAFLASLREKKAMKKRVTPQDIDPSFPTSDPELGGDNLDEEDEVTEEEEKNVSRKRHARDSDHHRHRAVFMQDFEEEEPRGRKQSNGQPKRAKTPSPRRGRSPAPGMLKRVATGTARSPPPPTVKRVPTATAHSPPPAILKRVATGTARSPPPPTVKRMPTATAHSPPPPTTLKRVPTGTARSPPPRGMFQTSPKRLRSPAPAGRLTSPPPSRRASKVVSPRMPGAYPASFLGQSERELTHTASLPRSPAPFGRRRRPSNISDLAEDEENEEDQQEKPYSRGAIDIIQGLEHKKLKRREKLYKHYWKCQEKEKKKKPKAGKGAERMRQIGIECAIYRGKRIISL